MFNPTFLVVDIFVNSKFTKLVRYGSQIVWLFKICFNHYECVLNGSTVKAVSISKVSNDRSDQKSKEDFCHCRIIDHQFGETSNDLSRLSTGETLDWELSYFISWQKFSLNFVKIWQYGNLDTFNPPWKNSSIVQLQLPHDILIFCQFCYCWAVL